MIAEEELAFVIHLLANEPRQVELLFQPRRHALQVRGKTSRRKGQVGLQQPLELHQRLIVEGHVIDALKGDARLSEAVSHRLMREAMIVLAAAEALLLRGGDDLSI